MSKNVKKGTLWDLLTYVLLQNIKKLEGGSFGDIEKISKKKSNSPKKINRGPLVSFGFVCYVKKGKHERGTLCTKFPLAGIGQSSSVIVLSCAVLIYDHRVI